MRGIKKRRRQDTTKRHPDEHLKGFYVTKGKQGLQVIRQVRGPDKYKNDVEINEVNMTDPQKAVLKKFMARFDW
jgi:hypothetical protein